MSFSLILQSKEPCITSARTLWSVIPLKWLNTSATKRILKSKVTSPLCLCRESCSVCIAVTLDGTVFHKAGLITGGSTNSGTGRKWEEAQVTGKASDMLIGDTLLMISSGLKKLEESLRLQLAELTKSRPRGNQDDRLTAEMSRLGTELTVAKDALVR